MRAMYRILVTYLQGTAFEPGKRAWLGGGRKAMMAQSKGFAKSNVLSAQTQNI